MPKRKSSGAGASVPITSKAPAPKKSKTAAAKKPGSTKKAPTQAVNPSLPAMHERSLPVRSYQGDKYNTFDLTGGDSSPEPDGEILTLFYSSGTSGNAVPPAVQNLNKMFDQYREQPKIAPDKIGIEGAQRYLVDLDVQLEEVAHLALCDLLQCPSIGEFEREAFVSGWRSLPPATAANQNYDTIARQVAYVPLLRKKVASDTTYFKQVYRNAFILAKPEGQKSVPAETAVEFWRTFFSASNGGIEWNTARTAWLDLWTDFYATHVKRPVNKDLWNMVGELMTQTQEVGGESLSWWTEDGAWPMAVDDFVAYVKEKRGGQTDSMDTS